MKHIVHGEIMTCILPHEPIIFCGDLNAGPNSPVHRLLSTKLSDAEDLRPNFASAPTFYSAWPMLRLDHIFDSSHLKPVCVTVMMTGRADWRRITFQS